MKREKRLTKKERLALDPNRAQRVNASAAHIHCISCGRHIDPPEFNATPPTALYLVCEHKSSFPACTECQVAARYLIAEHDRTGNPVASASAWH
ncbi:MAG TPA: hypothetical protein VG937_21805 [Polyangiaceae bacterium]|jgi:hypothetical protein|nr:hypothetical protein [Polyangiaceae bacterium]